MLVHGSLATGAEEWEAQRPLADEGFRLLVLDRRGYGQSPAADGEDFLVDADDIADLMGDGAHLVGHSYGGLGVMFAAARRPEATKSLTLLEPAGVRRRPGPSRRCGRSSTSVREMWDSDLPDEEWVVSFLKAVGSDPDEFPPEFLAAAVPLVPVFRRGRPVWDADLPLAALAAASLPQARRVGRAQRGVRRHVRRAGRTHRCGAGHDRRRRPRDPVHRRADQRRAAGLWR